MSLDRRTVCTLLAAPLLRGTARAAGAGVRMVATEFPPYTGELLPGGGLASTITREALAAQGLDMSLQFRPWTRAVAEFQQGEHDGLIAAWYSVERARTMQFPRFLGISNRIGFMARAGSGLKIDDLSRLHSLRIGTVRGYANPPAFEAAHLQVDEAMDDQGNLRKLLVGRVDLALIDKGVAFYLMQTLLHEQQHQLVWLEPALTELPLYTAVSRGRPRSAQVLKALDQGLADLQSSGALAKLLRQRALWM